MKKSEWTLNYKGATKRLHEWNISRVVRTRTSQGQDSLTFLHTGVKIEAAPAFAFGEMVKVYRDGVGWFEGPVLAPVCRWGPSTEEVQYTVANPWYYLDRSVYLWNWNAYNGAAPDRSTIPTSHVLLNVNSDGTAMSTQDQVLQILQAAIAAGVPMQLAPAAVALWFDQTGQKLYPPVDDLRDVTYAEAIRHQLRYHPDAVIGFGYSSSPPSIFVTRQAGGVVRLDFDEYRPEGEIRPRHDLVRAVVVVNWERTRRVNGREMTEMWVDRWPLNATGRELGALVMTIESRGPTTTEMTSFIETWAVDTGSLVWWTDRAPWLADPRVKNLKFATEAGYQVPQRAWSALPQELLNGQIADWMQLNGQALRVEDDRATGWFDYDFEVVPGRPEKMRTKRVDYPFRATDGISGYYRTITSEGGELVLLELAKYLQTGVGKVYWEGSITITEPEVQDRVTIGNKLWLLGLNPEWATMNAIVQQVVDDVDAGITTVSFGPPARLKAGDLLSLLK